MKVDTKTVKFLDGKFKGESKPMTINATDFDRRIHEEVAAAPPPKKAEAKEEKPGAQKK